MDRPVDVFHDEQVASGLVGELDYILIRIQRYLMVFECLKKQRDHLHNCKLHQCYKNQLLPDSLFFNIGFISDIDQFGLCTQEFPIFILSGYHTGDNSLMNNILLYQRVVYWKR